MKRRNADCGKLRRPLKRSKITEGIYGSTFMYVKFVLVWALVLLADFLLAFRFEYLWPFWLLLRSVYDSFKYQGLAFSVFFMCVAITSDVVCYLFIPVQWLFFAASTYVWVQYVWHTERGICLPTVSLWLLFVYIEASMRLREFKSLPFQLDLCRPFAAHCIGYPVVTLGFGFKSYVSYRMRVRKQKDVQNENDFYLQLLQQALPSDQQTNSEKQKALPSKSQEEVISNGVAPSNTQTSNTNSTNTSTTTTSSSTTSSSNKKSNNKEVDKENNKKSANNATMIEDYQFMEQNPPPKKHNVNDYDEDENYKNEQHAKSYKANGVAKNTTTKLNSQKDNANKKGKNINSKDSPTTTYTNNKDDVLQRLESDVKRLKIDLQSSRNTEQELRSQINNLLVGDKSQKSELYQLRQDNESLQTKLHNLVTSRQTDKKNLAAMERKLAEERKLRTASDQQLLTERNAKKAEDAAAARAIAAAAARGECTDTCKLRRSQIESELKQIRRDFKLREDQIRQLERERQSLRQYKDAQNETEVLMSALSAMQDKNTHLENSLSAETRVKLDLFSALGEAKRQIEIQQGMLLQKDDSIADLKSKMAEVLALMPTGYTSHASPDSSQHFSGKFTPASSPPPPHDDDVLSKSSLNPNATDYTPKSQ